MVESHRNLADPKSFTLGLKGSVSLLFHILGYLPWEIKYSQHIENQIISETWLWKASAHTWYMLAARFATISGLVSMRWKNT